jgi:hypothetical protein
VLSVTVNLHLLAIVLNAPQIGSIDMLEPPSTRIEILGREKRSIHSRLGFKGELCDCVSQVEREDILTNLDIT